MRPAQVLGEGCQRATSYRSWKKRSAHRLSQSHGPYPFEAVLLGGYHFAPKVDAVPDPELAGVAIGSQMHWKEAHLDAIVGANDTVLAIPMHDVASHVLNLSLDKCGRRTVPHSILSLR
jgi:hypothetical protein